MKNKKLFNESVESASEINLEIKQVLTPEISKLQKLFKGMFGYNGATVKKYSECFVSSSSAAPKIKKVLETFGEFYTINKLNNDYFKIDSYLKEKYNIVIDQNETPKFKSKKQNKIEDLWVEAFGDDYNGQTKIESLDLMLTKINNLITEIEKNKLQYSEEILPEVEQECEITKSIFNSIVGFKTAEKSGKDPQEKLDDIRNKLEILEEIMNDESNE